LALGSIPKSGGSDPRVCSPTTRDKFDVLTGAIWHTGDETFTPSAVAEKWAQVQDFTTPEHPVNSEDGDMMVCLAIADIAL
jgi:hypothetical protein